ncbi:MAG TPA: hypothetical protein VM597_08345 [Gemmataceae bacterium]|nr:hypothetical protein [Gemmataceae bacterium]
MSRAPGFGLGLCSVKEFAVLRSLVALLAAAPLLGAPGVKEKEKLYFPVTVGDTLVTSSERKGATDGDTTWTVTKVDGKDGRYVVTVQVDAGGGFSQAVEFEVSANGVFVLARGGVKVDPPAPQVKLSAKAGERWETGFPKGTATMGKEEEVEVPAGKFKAVRVDAEYDVGMGRTQKTAIWFAPRVGPVKSVTTVNGFTIVSALKSFTPGK